MRLPKIYNGLNKTFFMFTYEGYREGSPQPLVLSVPAPGDAHRRFLQVIRRFGPPDYDVTIPPLPRAPAPYARTPFPNNIIPANRIDPIAAKIATYYPQPNITSPGLNYSQDNYFAPGGYSTAVDRFFYNTVLAKIDHNLNGRSDHLFFSVRDQQQSRTVRCAEPTGDWIAPGADGPLPLKRVNKAYELDWISTLSPTMVLDAHISYGRYIEGNFGGHRSGVPNMTSLSQFPRLPGRRLAL